MIKSIRTYFVVLGVLIAGLLFSGCGSSGSDSSDTAPTVTTVPIPEQPQNITASPADGGAVVMWDVLMSPPDNYRIYWSTADSVKDSDDFHEVDAPPLQIDDLSNGTPVHFRVAAVNSSGESVLSSQVSVTPAPKPAAPAQLQISNAIVRSENTAQPHVDLSWQPSAGAKHYRIYWQEKSSLVQSAPKAASSNPFVTLFNKLAGSSQAASVADVPRAGPLKHYIDTTATSYSLALEPGKEYEVSLSAINDSGETFISATEVATQTIATPSANPASPESLKIRERNSHELDVSWARVAGAQSYRVYYGLENNVSKNSAYIDVDTNEITLHQLQGQQRYQVSVTAVIDGHESALSTQVSRYTEVLPPAPSGLSLTPSDGKITVSWDLVPGAHSYEVYWDTSSGLSSVSQSHNNSSTQFDLASLANGQEVFVAVAAVNSLGAGSLSAEERATPLGAMPSVPVNLQVSTGPAHVYLDWDSAAHADSYRIYWDSTPTVTTASNLIDVHDIHYVFTPTDDSPVYFALSAVNSSGQSALSTEVSAALVPVPQEPMQVRAVPADSQITLSWGEVAGASGYDVYWSNTANITTADTLINTGDTHVTVTALSNGTAYYFAVRASNSSGNSSLSHQVSSTPLAPTLIPGAPVIANIMAADSEASVSWGGVNGAETYTLYYGTSAALTTASAKQDNITGLKATLTSLSNGSNYYFAVTASNIAGESALSSVSQSIAVPPLPVAPQAVTAVASDGAVTVQWQSVDYVSGYQLYWSTSSSVTTGATRVDVTDSDYSLSGLNNGDTYYFAVLASNASGNSVLSSEVNATPKQVLAIPQAPAKPTLQAQGADIKVSWLSVNGASNYRVYYDTRAGVGHSASQSIDAGGKQSVLLSGLNGGQYYYIKLSASNASGESALSPEANQMALAIPTQLTGVVASGADAQISINWSAMADVDAYEVYWSTIKGAGLGGTKVDVAASDTHVVLNSGIINGTTYYAVVRAKNASGAGPVSAEASAQAIAPTPKPGTPTLKSLLAGTDTLDVSWSGVTGADEYTLYYDTSASVSTSSPSVSSLTGLRHKLSGLVSGSTYYVAVSASNGVGSSALSTSRSAQVPAAPTRAPSKLSLVAADGSITVNWDAIPLASYELYYGINSGINTDNSTKIATNTDHYTLTGLNNGSVYYVAVRAVNASGASALTPELSATPFVKVTAPNTPSSVTLSAVGADLKVTWPAVAGATGYTLYHGDSSGLSTASASIDVGTALNYTLTTSDGIIAGANYYVAVAAVNSAGASTLSSERSTKVLPIPVVPSGFSAVGSDGKISFHWSAAQYADSYELYWSPSSAVSVNSGTLVDTTDTHVQISQAIVNGQRYYAKVRARNASGSSALSSEVAATAVAPTPKPGVPHLGALVAGGGKAANDGTLSINWSAVSGASSYTVYYGVSSGLTASSSKVSNLTGLSHTLTGLTAGSQYYIALSAHNIAGDSAHSYESSSWVPALPTAPTINHVSAADGAISLQWTAVANADYELYWSTTSPVVIGGSGVTKFSAADPSLSHATMTGLSNNTPIYVAVAAVNASGSSVLSNEISAMPHVLVAKPAAPNMPVLAASDTDLQVTWSAVAGADSYKIYYGSQSGITQHHAAVDITGSLTHSFSLSAGTTYYVAVSAINRGGESALSVEQFATVPPRPTAPLGITATAGDDAITLDWSDVAYVAATDAYKVYFNDVGGVTTADTEVSVDQSSLRLTAANGISNGTQYFIRVLASNASGDSILSQEVSAIPIAPTPAPSTPTHIRVTPSDSGATILWPAVSSATTYHLYWSENPGVASGGIGVNQVDLNGLSHALSGLTNNQAYFYRISAENSGGESALSVEKQFVPQLPKPATPKGLMASSGPSDGAFTASWGAVNAASSYKIYYSTAVVSANSPSATVTSLRHEVTGLIDGQNYHIAVVAVNADGAESDLSAAVRVTPVAPIVIPAQVTGVTAQPGKDSIRLRWDALSNALNYTVYWSENPGLSTAVSTHRNVSGNTLVLDQNTLSSGTTYHFKVLANNTAGAGPLSGEVMARSLSKPATPSITVNGANGAIDVAWTAVPASHTTYNIYYAKSSGVTNLSAKLSSSATTYTLPNLSSGDTYYVRVSSVSHSGSDSYESDLSTEHSAIVLGLPAIATNVTAKAQSGAIKLDWTAAAGATSYKVFYGGFSGVGRNSPASHVVVNAPATTVVVPNLNNGQTYYLAVIASNSVGDGLLSNEVSARPETPPVAITWWQLQTGDGALNLRYSPISHATSYNIYWSETAGVTTSANKQSTTHSTAHTITGLTNGTTYYVSITAVNGGGESSLAAEKSKAPRLAMPVAPKGFRADAGDKKVELSWQAIPNAIAYNVHWAAGAGVSHAHTDTTSTGYQVNKVLIPSGTTTSFSVDQVQTVSGGATTDLVNGTAYFFTIQAVNASGDGAKAVEISATPQAPSSVPTIPTGLSAEPGDEAVTLQWAAVAGASSYKVYWGAGSVGTQFVENIAGSEMAIVSGLSDGTSYSFTVAAVNSSGESGQSAAITASPLNLIDAALVDGDSSKLNASEEPALIERILSELSGALNAEQTAAMNMIYGANSAVKYHPAASSQLLACSNSATCIPMMIALDSTQKIRHLAYANEVSGTKAIAYGSMPPIQFMENSPVLDYQQAFKNTIHWLTGIDPATAPLKVAVININYYAAGASGYTFSNWVQREYLISGNYFTPSPVPAGKYPWELTFCDGPPQVSGSVHIADDEIAAKCFANQDLVIIGDGAMMAGARDAVKLGAATQSALASNVPVMFFNSGWATTDAGKAVVQALGMSFPEPGSGNFFVKAQSDWPDYAAMLKAVASGSPLKTTINHLKSASYFPDWSQCAAGAAGRVYCIPTQWQAGVKDYAKEFEDGAAEAMSKLKSLEESGTDLFALKGHNLEKLLVLLGDVYRKQIIYPMEKGVTSDHEFLKASFADHLVYNVRHVEFTPPDMGDFFDVSTISSIVTQPLTRSFKPNARGGSTSVGAYLLPGKKVTIRRTGSGTKNIKVFVNMMRPNGTREFDAIEETWAQAGANNWVRKLNKGYSRPKFVQSAHITLPPNGSVTLTPAYGGPLYADITGESADISLEISNAAEHAFLQDGSQQDQVSQYQIDLAATNLPWTDIKTNFVEIHSLTEFMRAAIKPPPFNGDLTKMLELTWIYEVKDTYDFAGFTGPGLDLTQKVKDFCTSKTWNCIDADIHASPKTLHINTDYHASCGGMCSGNPFDSSEYFNPLGWGESHELGHNLQKARTKIFDRKSGEVSNNIFPLHKMSSYYKVDQMNISSDYWHRLEYYKTFTLLQAAKAAHPADLDARRQAAFQAIWAKTGAYDQNGERVTFYRQIAHLGDMLPALFDNGWEIFTLLHLHERLFTDAIQSDAGWQANKDALGFTHANYANYIAAQGVNKGEVFMPISLSFITGINLVNFFETWGIDVSAEAEAQIAAYGFPAWTEVFYVPALVETGTVGQEKGKAHAFRSMRESTSTPVYPAGTEVSLDGVSTFPVLPGSAPIVAPHLPGP